MKEFPIRKNEAGQRLDKYLGKLMKKAPKSFFYKMLRKKNITLNGKKAEGREILLEGDLVRIFVSDETFRMFMEEESIHYPSCRLDVIYEDQDLILINKPAGMLTQPDSSGKAALSDYLTGFLLERKTIKPDDLRTFHPAPANRLDRNTSGLVLCGKSLSGLQLLSRVLHDRTIHKDYLCLVEGIVRKEKYIKGYLHKDKSCNKVVVTAQPENGSVPVETKFKPVAYGDERTLLLVRLITGKPHQIRATMASIGFPVAGDPKYHASGIQDGKRPECTAGHQMLHAWRVVFPELEGKWEYLSGRTFYAPLPGDFRIVLDNSGIKEIDTDGQF